LRLPKVENGVAIRILEIIGGADGLGPIPSITVSNARNPSSCGLVGSVAEPKLCINLDEDRLLRDLQS
jgi:hypothetical protein